MFSIYLFKEAEVSLLIRMNRMKKVFMICSFSLLCVIASFATGDNPSISPSDNWSDYIPMTWQEDIVMPELITSVVIISKTPSATAGNTDIRVRYTIKNDGLDTLNSIQINFDLATQIGTPPFGSLTGSLTALAGSGSVFGSVISGSGSVFGGQLNNTYNATTNDSLFSTRPSLGPDECISVDVSFEVGDTLGFATRVVSAIAGGTITSGANAGAFEDTSPGLVLIQGCESESLACSGNVNVTLGTDCKAKVTLSSVFLNAVVDPSRYDIEVFDGNVSLGDSLNESHVGKVITYNVIDKCFGDRAACWGNINVENKNTPQRTSTYREIFCGEDPPGLISLEQFIANTQAGCYIPLSNFTESYIRSGERCDTGLIRRVIFAEFEIDGWKTRDTIHVDSILELNMEINMIDGPIGGPDASDAIYVDCDDLGGGEPTPSFLESYFNSLPGSTGNGVAYAYPYIDNGTTTPMEMYETRDTIIETRRDTAIIIDSILVNVKVVEKDTITITDTTTIFKPYQVPIKEGTTCNITASYSDTKFPGCVGPESKILRTWRMLNWCKGQIQTYDQWIIIQDYTKPNITVADTLEAYITPWNCDAELQLSATVSDNCSPIRNVNWVSTAGFVDENDVLKNIEVSDSPIRVTLVAIDACGNDSSAVVIVNVIDAVSPVAVAKDQINTNIIYDPVGDRGLAKITAESVDAGSHDSNCGPVILCVLLDEELRNPIFDSTGVQATDADGNLLYVAAQCDIDGTYKGTPYVICKDAVKLCCDDVGEVRVALLANDGSPHSAPGISWTTVSVKDDSFPIVSCESKFVACGDNIDPSVLGYPTISNGLCNEAVLTYSDVEDISDCGTGSIDRIWILDGDTSCVQTIEIAGSSAFDPLSIKWPKHYDDQTVDGLIRTCNADTIVETFAQIRMGDSFVCGESLLDQPVWCDAACSMLFMSSEDTEVEAGEACKKIIRTWTIIDWCTYQPNTSTDEDNDVFEAVSDEGFTESNILGDLVTGDDCISCDKPSNQNGQDIFFRYTSVDRDGFYNFDQIIKIVDNTSPVIDVPEEVIVEITDGATTKTDDFDDCVGTTVVSAIAIDLCGDVVLDVSNAVWSIVVADEEGDVISNTTAFGDSVSVMVTGAGNTEQTITWSITDGCDNDTSFVTTVLFNDILAPTPICISGLSTATMNLAEGTATIWASDYDIGGYDNCSEVKAFFRTEDGFTTPSLIFTCDDIPNGRSTVKQLELFVSDEAGNESSCNVSIIIDDNNNVCEDTAVGSARISGLVMTSLGDMIEGVRVSLNGRDNAMTDETGVYAFADVPMASSYKIDGNKNNDHLNGVSTLDLVLIQRHILAIERFDSPYKSIAGDANSDQRVSAIDLVHLRRLILGLTESFTENESWRFIDPAQTFESVTSPWPFTEDIVIFNLAQDMSNQNLLGVKIGDVSGNAIANSLLADGRSAKTVDLEIEDQLIRKGESSVLSISLEDAMSLTGLQFELAIAGAQIKQVSSRSLEVNEINYVIKENEKLAFSWTSPEGIDVSKALIDIEIVALRDIQLSNDVKLQDELIGAEIYDASLETFDMGISFDNAEEEIANAAFELMQNVPNPFNNQTSIGFRIPTSGDVVFSVVDISGRVIYNQEATYDAGYHEITLNKTQLQSRGVVYYTIQTETQTDTKKMILID